MTDQSNSRTMSDTEIEAMAVAAGMVSALNLGSGSCVTSSEGCNGITQGELERFAELVRAAERERIAKHLEKQSAEYMANATNNRFLTDHGRAIMTSASDWAETTAAAIRALK